MKRYNHHKRHTPRTESTRYAVIVYDTRKDPALAMIERKTFASYTDALDYARIYNEDSTPLRAFVE